MPHLALATSSKYSNLTDDDRLLVEPLSRHGIRTEPAIWNDPSYDWASCCAVIIRSCWDYHLQPGKFICWVTELESAKIPVYNSVGLVRWNANKSYLRELEAKGVEIVPTFWADDGDLIDLPERLRELGWHNAVVKPRISATAYRTQLVSAEDAEAGQALFDDLRRSAGVMVQKFMEGIATEGEWSLMFFSGAYSHAVLKKPKRGDFRVQNDFGGTARLADPPPHVLQSAIRAVNAVDSTLYARVDGVVDSGRLLLMELELIEPALFLSDDPVAPTRFADAIARALAQPR